MYFPYWHPWGLLLRAGVTCPKARRRPRCRSAQALQGPCLTGAGVRPHPPAEPDPPPLAPSTKPGQQTEGPVSSPHPLAHSLLPSSLRGGETGQVPLCAHFLRSRVGGETAGAWARGWWGLWCCPGWFSRPPSSWAPGPVLPALSSQPLSSRPHPPGSCPPGLVLLAPVLLAPSSQPHLLSPFLPGPVLLAPSSWPLSSWIRPPGPVLLAPSSRVLSS